MGIRISDKIMNKGMDLLNKLQGGGLSGMDHDVMANTPGTLDYAQEARGNYTPTSLTAMSGIPIASDVAGLKMDYEMFRGQPESRTPLNFGLSALGALPFVPPMAGVIGDMGKVYNKGKITKLDPSMETAPRVSQRVPTPTQAPDAHQRSDLNIDLDAMKYKPEAFKKNMMLLQESDTLPFSGYKSPDRIAEEAMKHYQGNLMHIKDNTPQEFFDRSGNWYKGANSIANDITQTHGVPIQASAGVLARLSPKWDWLKNVENADRLVDIWKNQSDTKWTSAMSKVAPEALTKKLRGTRLKDLDSLDKALWIRIFDQAHNPQTYRAITPEGLMGGTIMTKAGKPSKHVMQSNANLKLAIDMLEDPSMENISRQLGKGHKIRNFYNNIGDPFYGGDITIDTHAIAADTLSPLGSGAREVDQNFGGLGTSISQGAGGTYGLHADAYRNVADELGIIPGELQSPTWETIRETFINKPQNAPIIEQMWRDVERGITTSGEARDRVMDYFGGYQMPSWFDQ